MVQLRESRRLQRKDSPPPRPPPLKKKKKEKTPGEGSRNKHRPPSSFLIFAGLPRRGRSRARGGRWSATWRSERETDPRALRLPARLCLQPRGLSLSSRKTGTALVAAGELPSGRSTLFGGKERRELTAYSSRNRPQPLSLRCAHSVKAQRVPEHTVPGLQSSPLGPPDLFRGAVVEGETLWLPHSFSFSGLIFPNSLDSPSQNVVPGGPS